MKVTQHHRPHEAARGAVGVCAETMMQGVVVQQQSSVSFSCTGHALPWSLDFWFIYFCHLPGMYVLFVVTYVRILGATP